MNGLALCAGYGGLEFGIERVLPGARTVCYVEGECFAVQHLVKKMEEGRLDEAPIWSNVKTFRGQEWRGKVDWISGGFPCQPYSTAGKQLGEADPRDLWPDFVRIIGEVRPGFLFFENVPNIVKLRLDQIVLDLDKLGYHASWCVVAASDVGAPHQRKRWFLLAVRNTDCPGLMEHQQSKESRQGIIGKGEMAGDRPQDLSDSHTNSQRSGRYENKQCSSERKSNLERVRGKVSHPDKIGRREIPLEGRESIGKMPGLDGHQGGINTWHGGFETVWKVEPGMGRLVDGASDWVDKLRILGNGVVPQQAAYAFQILGERLAAGIVEKRTPKD